MTRVLLLRGDGIGVELIDEARRTLTTCAPDVELEEARIGLAAFERTGQALPDAVLTQARRTPACLLVAVGSPLEPRPGYQSPVVGLRQALDLYANLRPVRSIEGRAVDLLIVRENTEGLYAGDERRTPDGAIGERRITVAASARIARMAGRLASQRRRRVCVVHKANVLRETCGLFRATCLNELASFEGLEVEEMLVDHAAYRLAADPERFDVLVTTNLFGDVLSDVAAHAGGGLGLVTSANLGERHALFEPVHGSAPDLAGRDLANPIATLRACAGLLVHVGETASGRRLEAAIEHVLDVGPRTADLGGTARTRDVTDAVLRRFLADVDAFAPLDSELETQLETADESLPRL